MISSGRSAGIDAAVIIVQNIFRWRLLAKLIDLKAAADRALNLDFCFSYRVFPMR